jgi:ribonuclease HI
MTTIVYTDGSTLNNQHKGNRKGGIGVFFGDNDIRNKSISLVESDTNKVTNQVSELTACIVAVETIICDKNHNNILICTDSMYTINCITKWCKKWKTNNWKKSDGKDVENVELISKLYDYYDNYNIKFKHIKAHKTEPSKDSPIYNEWYGNMMADKLATNASNSIN